MRDTNHIDNNDAKKKQIAQAIERKRAEECRCVITGIALRKLKAWANIPKFEDDESTHQHEMALEIYTLLMDDGYKMDDLKEVFMIY